MTTPRNRGLYVRTLAVQVCPFCRSSKRPNSKRFRGHGLDIVGLYYYHNGKARRMSACCQDCVDTFKTLDLDFDRLESDLPADHIINVVLKGRIKP